MDEPGVGQAAIVHSSTTYGHDASYAADSVARFRDRCVGACWSADDDNPYRGVLNQTRRAVSCLSEEEQRWFFGESARSVYTSLRAPVSPTP
jgi:hypothetical protein